MPAPVNIRCIKKRDAELQGALQSLNRAVIVHVAPAYRPVTPPKRAADGPTSHTERAYFYTAPAQFSRIQNSSPSCFQCSQLESRPVIWAFEDTICQPIPCDVAPIRCERTAV